MNIVGALAGEIQRCTELAILYRDIGPAGQFALMFIEQGIERAKKALAVGDAIEIMKSLEEMKGFTV